MTAHDEAEATRADGDFSVTVAAGRCGGLNLPRFR